ncbi:MAG TPA: putative baseplate assembly protein [Longimicrobiales bacterium]
MSDGFLFFCCDERRRAALRQAGPGAWNGIDFLEVVDAGAPEADRQRVLRVHFVHPPAAPLTGIGPDNIRIDGGERVPVVRAVAVTFAGDVLEVRVDRPGDFSTYTFRLVDATGAPFPGLDPLLAQVAFSFKADCPSDFDCAVAPACATAPTPPPDIDYLSKDYASFRQLMLDRMALVLPEWRDRNPADTGVALVELLAYVGDYLSYRQDAIATEAYLGTARHRVSVRRHARLLDYAMHDGCNARVWVQVRVQAASASDEEDGIPLAQGTQLMTRMPSKPAVLLRGSTAYADALAARPEVFETMHAALLFPQHDTLYFHTWGERECALPRGATRATLRGDHPKLRAGDVLLFEEVLGPRTGAPEDADRTRRHAVRLTAVRRPLEDPLLAQPVTEIEWGIDDALPFAFCISAVTDAEHGGRLIEDVSVARGNIVLADHGRTIGPEPLGAPPAPDPRLAPAAAGCGCGCDGAPAAAPPARFRPALAERPVTQAARVARTAVVGGRRERLYFDPDASAAAAFRWEMQRVLPVVRLEDAAGRTWLPQRDLLASDAFATEFVVEVEDDGTARIRFGDDEYGQRPAVGVALDAVYRVGNGTRGNVGAESIAHIALDAGAPAVGRVVGVRNPLPARGGVDPETIEEVRQNAPAAFRTLERAVTPEDYATIAQRHPEVQRARATVRWTGSWRTVFLSVDRKGGRDVDAAFERELREFLERYRMAGHELEIDGPRYVWLELELRVCVAPGYFRSDVRRALLEVFSAGTLRDGRRGLFHPDNFTFGQPVYLSRIYAAAQAVAGVQHVEVVALQRLGQPSRAALETGALEVGRLEIARLDNDPNFPERGVLRLDMEGGR